MANDQTRRNFLRTAPLAAAAVLPLTETMFASTGSASAGPAPAEPFQLFSAAKLDEAMKTLNATPGNDNLFAGKAMPVTIVLTVEKAKAAKEFEYHEGRDHIFQVIDGSTVYELGGTPKNARNTKPGEWLAPASEGASKMTLNKGDMLVIPRGTPHKRTTTGSVTFTLISTEGVAKG